MILVYKAKQDKKPTYIYDKISTPFNVNTRLARSNGIKENWRMKSKIGKQSFIARATTEWNRLPPDIRTTLGYLRKNFGYGSSRICNIFSNIFK